MRTNVKTKVVETTHEGGKAMSRQPALLELTRAVSTCLLFENTFYETGDSQAARIADLCGKVAPEDIAALAVRARHELKLRHVPLFLCRQLVKHAQGPLVSETIAKVIRRPDEAGELLALYWADNDGTRNGQRAAKHGFTGTESRKGPRKKALAKQLKKGIAEAFTRFNAYQLAKWNKDSAAVKLKDALFLSHAEPKDDEQAKLWKQLIGGYCSTCWLPIMDATTIASWEKRHNPVGRVGRLGIKHCLCDAPQPAKLPVPDTWEVGLSAAKNVEEKRAVWVRLLAERKLGSMALLMNLRNMNDVGVPAQKMRDAIVEAAPKSWALPFRYVSAAKAAPGMADACSAAMLRSLASFGTKLDGETAVVVDVSGSMDDTISGKSQLTRWEAAGALAAIMRETCPACHVFTFSHRIVEVANYQGLPLVAAIGGSQPHGGTYLAEALNILKRQALLLRRVIVITDEQSHDGIVAPWTERAYLINVAGYRPALDTHCGWTRVSGWSERCADWIAAEEGVGLIAQDEEEE